MNSHNQINISDIINISDKAMVLFSTIARANNRYYDFTLQGVNMWVYSMESWLCVREGWELNALPQKEDPEEQEISIYEWIKDNSDEIIEIWMICALEEQNNSNLESWDNVDGKFVHMINMDLGRWELEKFTQITGEVCVSSIWEEDLYITHAFLQVGIVLEGIARKLFNYDVGSEIAEDGRRHIPSDRLYSKRTEGWVVPAESRITGIYFNGYIFPVEKWGDIRSTVLNWTPPRVNEEVVDEDPTDELW